jgi:hypothetical protein
MSEFAFKWSGYNERDNPMRDWGAWERRPAMADPKHPRKFSGEFKRQIVEPNNDNKSPDRDTRRQRYRQLDPAPIDKGDPRERLHPCLKQLYT